MILPYVGAAIAVVLVAVLSVLPPSACCYRPERPTGHVLEWHHGYLVALCGIPPEAFPPLSAWVPVVVVLIALDDLYQHVRQLWQPQFRSPLHELARRVGLI